MDNAYKSESKFLNIHIKKNREREEKKEKRNEMECSCTFITFKTEQSILHY